MKHSFARLVLALGLCLGMLACNGATQPEPAQAEAPREYTTRGAHREQVRGWKARGETDRLDELSARLTTVLGGPECGVLAANKTLTLEGLEALLADLPGDHRERVQDALGGNPTACVLLDVSPADVITNYQASAARARVEEWKTSREKQHRIALVFEDQSHREAGGSEQQLHQTRPQPTPGLQ
jgi:hypothetical protein